MVSVSLPSTNIYTIERKDNEEEEIVIANKKETRDVIRLKLIVLTVLLISSISVSCLVFSYTRNQEVSKFEDQIASDASKVLESIGRGIEDTFRSLDVLATSIVTHVRNTNQRWPLITMNHFANSAAKVRSLSFNLLIWTYVIVPNSARIAWETYAYQNRDWVNESISVMETDNNYYGPIIYNDFASKLIFGSDGPIPYNESRRFAPQWLSYPAIPEYEPAYNWDWLSSVDPEPGIRVIDEGRALLTAPYMLPDPNNPLEVEETEEWADWYKNYVKPGEEPNEPISSIIYPIIDDLRKVQIVAKDDKPLQHQVVAMTGTDFYWRDAFRGILPIGHCGVVVVVENPCSSSPFTYQIDGPLTKYLGRGDHHDSKYEHLKTESSFSKLDDYFTRESTYSGVPLNEDYCPCTISVYPSDVMYDEFVTNNPAIFAAISFLIFVFTSIVFIVYDSKVERRQKMVMSTALKTSTIVSSLFPSNVRGQLLSALKQNSGRELTATSQNAELQSFLNNPDDVNVDDFAKSRPIADLYPETTVFFADIAGFTAWSSVRDPAHIFALLESIYSNFDRIARKRRIFKVETIGDSYVAVAGLPEPMKHHAVVMARFSSEVLLNMLELTKKLAIVLGPDTAELKLRVGLNSGPTTAGVLRGERCRFQLFGDTVNTASRMETSSLPGKIHCTQETAALLTAAGKGHWLTKRDELIIAKGKGSMQTYWVLPASSYARHSSFDESDMTRTETIHRLIDWNFDLLEGILVSIVSDRSRELNPKENQKSSIQKESKLPSEDASAAVSLSSSNEQCTVTTGTSLQKKAIDDEVQKQLRTLVTNIASMYKAVPFHNFEHATHVVISTTKILEMACSKNHDENKYLDPLSYFTIIFGVLIQCIDHQVRTHSQFNKGEPTTKMSQNEIVVEPNSFAVAWNLLMRPDYKELRQSIFGTETELKRFRQILLNVVLVTDSYNKGKLVADTFPESSSVPEKLNLETATIIAYAIQAGCVSHTMQNWTVYEKCNYRLFKEHYASYKTGRSNKHPSECWYENDLWLFDNFVIPLAEKIKLCGLFDLSCDKFLDYATNNRLDWESKGREIVSKWTTQVEAEADLLLR